MTVTDDLRRLWVQSTMATHPMRDHVARLCELARGHPRILELGLDQGHSTVGLLMSDPERVVSVDLYTGNPRVAQIKGAVGDVLTLLEQDSRLPIDETFDLCFIDSEHTAEQLAAEFATHAQHVTRTIVLHDTTSYPCLWRAIAGLVDVAVQEWYVAEHWPGCNGLTVLRRGPRPA